ncbi:PREDICTED: rRNA methyltransferase 3A, mitochondrial-like [Priapulus caudatus]|uniref:rRNA methyltransferase 3A, mitochondrial-like n=1 Tax=Priapulus caudatus TaxID=37621 RepID=A0ABM1DVP0_PRICU|nr:PREDICTED: rRNA methyltransferase 3A, mitochondrial-like [Priapulus caudatus]
MRALQTIPNVYRCAPALQYTCSRSYGRYLRRVPKSILTQTEADEFHRKGVLEKRPSQSQAKSILDTEYAHDEAISRVKQTDKRSHTLEKQGHATSTTEMSSNISFKPTGKVKTDRPEVKEYNHRIKKANDSPLVLFDRLQDSDKRFSNAMMDVKSRKKRESMGKILLEGKRLIRDAILAGAQADSLFFTKRDLLSDIPLDMVGACKLYKISYKQMCLWSDVETPSGIVGIFNMPRYGDLKIEGDTMPLTVICDNIRDPGNMGVILRTLAAVGCKKVLMIKGCVDVWEPKVIRAAAGAHFRVGIYTNVVWPAVKHQLPAQAFVCLADSSSKLTIDIDVRLRAPPDDDDDDDGYEISVDAKTGAVTDPSYAATDLRACDVRCIAYTQLYYAGRELVLVVGGETQGLSAAAVKLARDCDGFRVYVPMSRGVDSLNAATAMAVIAFEMKRQTMDSSVDADDAEEDSNVHVN